MLEIRDTLFNRFDKRLHKLADGQDRTIIDQLNDLNAEIEDIVGTSSNTPSENRLLRPLTVSVVAFFTFYADILKTYNSKALDLNVSLAEEIINIYKNNPSIDTDLILSKLPEVKETLVDNFFDRVFPTDPKTVGERIVSLRGSTLNTVRNILAVEIDKGTSAKDLSKLIQNVIRKDDRKKWVSPFEYYRNRFGIIEKVQPFTIKAGSLDFQSIRIARTEINQTYRSASLMLHSDQPYLSGWEWRLSPNHPEYDICDELARKSPYKTLRSVPKTPHPNCMCSVLPVLINPDEI